MDEPKKLQNYKYIRREPYLFGFRSTAFIYMVCTVFALLFSLAFLWHYIIWVLFVVIGCIGSIIYFRFFYEKEIKFLSNNSFPKEINDLTKNIDEK